MDRRSFFSNTAALGAGAAAIPLIGCGPSLRSGPVGTFSEAEAAALVAGLRRSLDATTNLRVASRLVPDSGLAEEPGLRGRLDFADALADKAVHALLIADVGGRFRSNLADPERVAPYLAEFAPLLDDAVTEHTALLARAPVRQKRLVSERIRRDPGLPMRLGEELDAHARALGVSADGRGKMRRILAEVSARSRVQSFGVVVDDYVDKVQRVAARCGQDVAFARALATSASAEALWAIAPSAPAATAPAASTSPPWGSQATDPETPRVVDARVRGGSRTIRTGLWTGGIGLATFGLGAGIAAAGGGIGSGIGVVGLLVATLGAVTVLVSLIMLLAGAIQSAVE